MNPFIACLLACFFVLFACSDSWADDRPNILLVVADDLGWTDLSSFGGEIETPNLDALAEQGIKFTDFHTSVSCSPTRSMLLTGTDNHIAGLGNMEELLTAEQIGKPGYEGYINNGVVTLAEVLRAEGYHTYLSGKWHLGHEPGSIPHDRGFEKSFSVLYGGGSYWNDMIGLLAEVEEVAEYAEDGEWLHKLPGDFYATRSFSDRIIENIRDNKADGKPFLAYLPLTAPHNPLHVPEPWLSQYRGRYDEGYEILKTNRIKAAKKLGLITASAREPDRYRMIKAWESLDPQEKLLEARGMEVYAGLVSNMDYHIGRVVQFLKDIGEYENTIVIFMSDNGPNAWYTEDFPFNRGSEWLAGFDNSPENIGHPRSHYAYGMGWAAASAGPFDLFKLTAGEGGIRTPLILAGPGIKSGVQNDSFVYVWDLMPTILDIVGIDHPKEFKGHNVAAMKGRSIKTVLSGQVDTVYQPGDAVAGEMRDGKWIRQGAFKAISVPPPYGSGDWHLYNVETDPGETNDLALAAPALLERLKKEWQIYADEVGVLASP